MTDSSDDITAHKANTPADVAAADNVRAALGMRPPARSSAESWPAKNTDREIYHTPFNSVHDDSIHVTSGGGIGINVAGHVIVKPLRDWHTLASMPAAAQPAPDLWRTALEGSNPAIWADSIERTTRTSVVRAADSHGEAMRKAHIDCLYDFEARRLVALLRAVASQTSPATTPTIDSVPSCGQENDFRQASPAVDLGLCDRVVCGACGCREVLAKEVERLTRARSAQAAAVETLDDVPSCGQENDYRRASPQPSSAATGDEPFGWFFECHVGRDEWAEGFSLTKPEDVGTVRNLTPLYRAVPQEAQVRFIPPVGTCAVCKKPPSKDCSICSTLSRPKPSTDR